MDDSTLTSITLQDVADRCGVSAITASRALRDDPRVREATKARVLQAAGEVGYDPMRNMAARRLAMQKHGQPSLNRLIALLVPNKFYTYTYFNQIFHGILDELSTEGYGVLCCYPDESAGLTELPAPLYRNEIDGLIFPASARAPRDIVTYLRQQPSFRTKPVVCLMSAFPETKRVGLDDYQGGYQVARHLLSQGHRHIIHYYHYQSYEQKLRLDGMMAAYREVGLDPLPHLHDAYQFQDFTQQSDESKEERKGTICHALEALPHATAVVARHDGHAISIWKALTAQGIRVPEDVSLVGFNDIEPITDATGQNLLTSVRTPLVEIGRQAARAVVDLVNHPQPSTEDLLLPVELVVRQSTAPPSR